MILADSLSSKKKVQLQHHVTEFIAVFNLGFQNLKKNVQQNNLDGFAKFRDAFWASWFARQVK